MSKHTPGPWIHSTDFGQVGSVETEGGIVIAQTQAMVHDHDRSQRNANARLIASAPDLLEALQAAYDALGISYPLYSCDMDKRGAVLSQARAAIAKATGEAA